MTMPLQLAALLLHRQLCGTDDVASAASLDRTALALSHTTEIYYVDEARILRALPQQELLRGVFEGGAWRFRTRAGNVYIGLFVRRRAVAAAAVTLRGAGRLLRRRERALRPSAPASSPSRGRDAA
jgi:hypothetical protein